MWQADDIAKATGGKKEGAAFEAACVAIDSRKLAEGALFVALKGGRVDGHDYVKEAFATGAAGALVQRVPAGLKKNVPLVVVADTAKALVDLGVAARAHTTAKIIAVTGSVGKTGTKDAIRVAAGAAGKVFATQGNLNNHIGLPLSLANLPHDARCGVFELGMNHAGEISFLTRIVRPDIAVITNVEAVHLEFFANVEAIADAKAEIMEGMGKDGTLVLNRDNRFYDRLHARAKERGILQVVTFGAHAQADCRLVRYALKDLGSQVEAVIHGTPVTYALGTIGRHYALALLAALAAAVAAGVDLADAAAALRHFQEPEGRGRLHRVTLARGPVTLIDDCYNASPSSVLAGIAKLSELQAAARKGRKIAVLGDMLELGLTSADLHRELSAALSAQGVDKVYAAGPLMKHLYDALPEPTKGAHAADSKGLAPLVAGALGGGDIVLIKGSRGMRMDTVRDALFAASHNPREVAHAV